MAKYADFKIFPEEAPNSTDVEGSLRKVKGDDPTLKELNLNNVKVKLRGEHTYLLLCIRNITYTMHALDS